MKYIDYLFFLLLAVSISSCREDIIQPDVLLPNKNEPVEFRSYNSYSFLINAENVTQSVLNEFDIELTKSRIFYSLTDYASGYVEIRLYTQDFQNVFYQNLSENSLNSALIDGFRPAAISIKFNNFTGVLKIELNRVF